MIESSRVPRATNIVLIDDDEIDVMSVQRAFAKGRLDNNPLYVASNGIEGLDLLRSGAVPEDRRLVLLDLNMPKMNGIEFLIELRADPRLRSTPVVVLTTSDDERDRLAAFSLNVAGYLLKPVGSQSFLQLMVALTTYWSLVEWP
jgi:CheY-like chemotaxis protein